MVISFKAYLLILLCVSFTMQSFSQDNFESSEKNSSDFSLIPLAEGNSASSIVRFSVSGGLSYRTIKNSETDPVLKEYVDELKLGFFIQTEVAYVFSDFFSAGLKYNLHKSSNELNDVLFEDSNGNIEVGTISDNVSIGFAGVVLNGRIFSENRKNILNAGISIGQIFYNNDAIFLDPINVEGNTIGMMYNIGYEYGASERFGIGLNINYGIGSITKVTQNGEEFDYPTGTGIGTGRLDGGVIIILHF